MLSFAVALYIDMLAGLNVTRPKHILALTIGSLGVAAYKQLGTYSLMREPSFVSGGHLFTGLGSFWHLIIQPLMLAMAAITLQS